MSARRTEPEGEIRSICRNRRARFEYHLLETYEAGLALRGSEVKSLRAGGASLGESYARVRDGQLFLCKAHIAPYDPASRENHEPERDRRLLLHRREIDKIAGRVKERGMTLVPLELYFKKGRAKVSLAIARGKRAYDKREDIAKREAERRIRRATKLRHRR
jgi:SsrA-binding protein